MDESDQLAYGFDLLDPTKFVPEEIVPITPLGKMTLNMNPKNYFAETEQIGVSTRIRGSEFAILTSIRLIVPTRPCRSWYRLH
jgi:catalase